MRPFFHFSRTFTKYVTRRRSTMSSVRPSVVTTRFSAPWLNLTSEREGANRQRSSLCILSPRSVSVKCGGRRSRIGQCCFDMDLLGPSINIPWSLLHGMSSNQLVVSMQFPISFMLLLPPHFVNTTQLIKNTHPKLWHYYILYPIAPSCDRMGH